MFLVEQFKRLSGLTKYDTATSITCNLDVLAHFVTSGKMPVGASTSEIEETLELMESLNRDEIVFIYDRVSFSEAYVKLFGDHDLVVVRYATAPGWDTWRVSATNDLVDRLNIRGKLVTDKKIIITLLGLPDPEAKEADKVKKAEEVNSNLTFDWSTPVAAPEHRRRSTDIQDVQDITPKPPAKAPTTAAVVDVEDKKDDAVERLARATQAVADAKATPAAPAPDNQMAAAFREANKQRNRGSQRQVRKGVDEPTADSLA